MGQDMILYLGAIALGALHAFEPGHGKTIIAAYMIGTRGRSVDGIVLGLIVTFTHTFSVIILGIIARLLAQSYTEEQLHGWLGLFSAILILTVGLWMLTQRLSGGSGHHHLHLFNKGNHNHHHHDHEHCDHAHHDHNHSHVDNTGPATPHTHDGHNHHAPPGKSAVIRHDTWNLLLLGISGGLVPCPAAIATLLAAIAAGRTTQGLTMVIFFSLGLGLVMMTIGVALAHAGKFANKLNASPELSRRMGILSASIITMLGGITLYHSIKTLWF